MIFPEHLRYTESHEWINVEGNIATVGITDYAQGELGDIVFLDIPEKKSVDKGASFGTIEAVKTVSDLYAPISGTILEVNPALDNTPDLVNSDCYGDGWMVKIEIRDVSELDKLLDVNKYKALIGK